MAAWKLVWNMEGTPGLKAPARTHMAKGKPIHGGRTADMEMQWAKGKTGITCRLAAAAAGLLHLTWHGIL
jgi:hypothetical protein